MRIRFARLLPLFALAALAPLARAEDDTPVARAKKALASLPAPAADKGFSYDLALTVSGAPIGSVQFVAEAVTEGDAQGWRCSESAEMPGKTHKLQELVDAHLAGIEGEQTSEDDSVTTRVAWERGEGGYAVKTVKGDGEPETATAETTDFPCAGITSMLLLARALPADKATYEMRSFEPERKKDVWFKKVTLTVEGVVEWKAGATTRQAWVVASGDGEQTMRLAFDPTTRAFLGALGVEMPIGMIPKDQVVTPKVDLSKPAADPKIAALKIGLAFAVGDKDLAASAVHWPSAFEAAMKEAGEQADPAQLEEFKAAVLSHVTESGPRAVIEPALVGSLDQFKTEKLENGNTKVTLPPMFQGLAFETREIDGVWLVVRLPSGPPGGN